MELQVGRERVRGERQGVNKLLKVINILINR